MANTTVSMSKIRKILRMYTNGSSIMSISAQADALRTMVKKYLAAFKDSGFTTEEVDALNVVTFKLYRVKDYVIKQNLKMQILKILILTAYQRNLLAKITDSLDN